MKTWLRIHLGILLIAPAFLIGGVHPITQIIAAGVAISFLLLSLLRRLLRSEEDTHWDFTWWGWLFLAALAMTTFQLLPLPPGLIAWLSPAAHETFRQVLAPLGLYNASHWQPLSLAPGDTAVKWIRDLGALSLFLGVFHWTRSREHMRTLIRLSVMGAVAVICLVLFQSLLGVSQPLMGLYQSNAPLAFLLKGSPFVNLNHLGAYLMFHSILCLFLVQDSEQGKERWLWIAALSVLSIGVLGSLSRGAILGYVIGVIGFIYFLGKKLFGSSSRHTPVPESEKSAEDKRRSKRKNKKRSKKKRSSRDPKPLWEGWRRLWDNTTLQSIVVLFVIVISIVLQWGGGELRDTFKVNKDSIKREKHVAIYQFSSPLLRHYPLVGVGRGAMSAAWPRYTSVTMLSKAQITATHVESQLIQPFVDWGWLFGLVFVVGVLFLLFVLFRRSVGILERSCWLALVVLVLQNAVDFNLEFIGTAFPFIALLAALVSLQSKRLRSGKPHHWPVWVGLGIGGLGLISLVWMAPYAMNHNIMNVRKRWRAVSQLSPAKQKPALRQLMRHHPADFTLPLYVAQSLLRQKHPPFKEVLQWLERAKHLNPTSGGLYYLFAKTYADLGLNLQAVLAINQAVKFDNAMSRPGRALAQKYGFLSLLLRRTTSLYQVHVSLSLWLGTKPKPLLQKEILASLRKRFPKDYVIYNVVLQLQFIQLRKAIRKKLPAASALRSKLLYDLRNCEKTVPNCPGLAMLYRGKIAAAEKRDNQALRYYREAALGKSHGWFGTRAEILLLVRRKKYELAHRRILHARARFRRHKRLAWLYGWEGNINKERKQYAKAERAYEEAITLGDQSNHKLSLAMVCWQRGRTRRAIKIVQRLAEKPHLMKRMNGILKRWRAELKQQRSQQMLSPIPGVP